MLTLACAAGISTTQAQYKEDALRFSQYGANVSARGLSMGSVGVGVADDYSALFTNPAGLAQIRSYEFSFGMDRTSSMDDASYFGTTTPGKTNATNISHIGIVYPIPTKRGSLTFAFGYGRVANFTSMASIDGINPSSSVVEALIPSQGELLYDWMLADRDGLGFVPLVGDSVRQSITVMEGGGINHWSVGGAMDLSPSISAGVTMNFVSGSYTYDRQFIETDPYNLYQRYVPGSETDFAEFRWESSFKSDLSGFNALFGVMFRKQGKFRVGATIRTPTNYEISETFSDLYESIADTSASVNPEATSGTTKYRVITPVVLALGASIMPTEWLTLAGDAEYTDWTQVQFDTDDPYLLQENRDIKTNGFRETWVLKGGVELAIWSLDLKLRGGMMYKPSPFKADENLPERDQVTYTAGIGFTMDENTGIDVGYTYGYWKTLRDNYSLSRLFHASRTDESITTNTIMATLWYRF